MAAEAAAAGASRLTGPAAPARSGPAAAPALRRHLPRSPPHGPAPARGSLRAGLGASCHPPRRAPARAGPGPFAPSSGGVGSSPESWPLPPRRLPSRACARRRRAARGVRCGRPASAVIQVCAGGGLWGSRAGGGPGRPGCARVCVGEWVCQCALEGAVGMGGAWGSFGIRGLPGLGGARPAVLGAAGALRPCGWSCAAGSVFEVLGGGDTRRLICVTAA